MIQFLSKMKYKRFLLVIWMLFSVLWLKGQTLNNKINIKLQNQPISELVKQIETQSHYHLYYDETHFSSFTLSMDIKGGTVEEVLDRAFMGTDVKFAILGDQYF